MNRNIIKSLVVVGALSAVTAANAAIDVKTATEGITDASTALLAVVGALMSLSVALFGITKVYAFIKRKSGA